MTKDPLPHLLTLGLQAGATREEVRKAYRDLSKVWHPDRFAGDSSLQKKAEEQLKAINDAYGALQSYSPSGSEGLGSSTGRPGPGRKMEERILRPRARFNPSERLPLVMTILVVVVVLLLVLTTL